MHEEEGEKEEEMNRQQKILHDLHLENENKLHKEKLRLPLRHEDGSLVIDELTGKAEDGYGTQLEVDPETGEAIVPEYVPPSTERPERRQSKLWHLDKRCR